MADDWEKCWAMRVDGVNIYYRSEEISRGVLSRRGSYTSYTLFPYLICTLRICRVVLDESQ